MLHYPNIPGLRPDPDGRAYSAPPDPLTDEEGGSLPPVKNLTHSGLLFTGLRVTDYRVGNHTNDTFQM